MSFTDSRAASAGPRAPSTTPGITLASVLWIGYPPAWIERPDAIGGAYQSRYGRSRRPCSLMTARSEHSETPRTSAVPFVSSLPTQTVTVSAPVTTWLFVTMRPLGSTRNPDPWPTSSGLEPGGGAKGPVASMRTMAPGSASIDRTRSGSADSPTLGASVLDGCDRHSGSRRPSPQEPPRMAESVSPPDRSAPRSPRSRPGAFRGRQPYRPIEDRWATEQIFAELPRHGPSPRRRALLRRTESDLRQPSRPTKRGTTRTQHPRHASLTQDGYIELGLFVVTRRMERRSTEPTAGMHRRGRRRRAQKCRGTPLSTKKSRSHDGTVGGKPSVRPAARKRFTLLHVARGWSPSHVAYFLSASTASMASPGPIERRAASDDLESAADDELLVDRCDHAGDGGRRRDGRRVILTVIRQLTP